MNHEEDIPKIIEALAYAQNTLKRPVTASEVAKRSVFTRSHVRKVLNVLAKQGKRVVREGNSEDGVFRMGSY